MQRHHVATTDEEEQAAIDLALAVSLNDTCSIPGPSSSAGPGSHMQPLHVGGHDPLRPLMQQHQQKLQHQHPQLPPQRSSQQAQPPPPQQRQQRQRPHQLLGALASRLAEPLGALFTAPSGPACAGCGKWLGLGPYLNAQGQVWHHACFRCCSRCSGTSLVGYTADAWSL